MEFDFCSYDFKFYETKNLIVLSGGEREREKESEFQGS